MSSKLRSEKAVKLLEYRGQKELANALRRCWLALDVRGGDPYLNSSYAFVQIHAPLVEYEFLRNLPTPEGSELLKTFKELYSTVDVEIRIR